MTNDWYTADDCHVLKVKKGSLTAWRNAEAKLIASEVQKMDQLISCRLFEPIAMAQPTGEGATFLPKYRTTKYIPGRYQEVLNFQTAMQLYPSVGLVTTADNTPGAGDYTHTGAIRTTQTPLNMGRHLERENITDAESERIDIFGMLCNYHHIECSQAFPTATQSLDWSVASTLNTGTDDIPSSICDDKPFKWEHFTFPTFTYGGETIEADILGWSLDIQNTTRLVGLDSTKKFSIGKYIPLTYISATIQIFPYGHNAFELIRTALEGYATDLDLTVVATRTAATDLITFTHDKLYCSPFDIAQYKTPGSVETYYMRMHQLNTGSFVPVSVDKYDDDYYET